MINSIKTTSSHTEVLFYKPNKNKYITRTTYKNSDLVAKLIKVRTENALSICSKNKWLEPIVKINRLIRAKFNKIKVYEDKLNKINPLQEITINHLKK